jgi:acetyl-CoA carboxylase beta subunit
MIDAIVDRREMRNYIIKILGFMMNPEINGEPEIEKVRGRSAIRK